MEIEIKIPLENVTSIDSIISDLIEKFGPPIIKITQIDTYFRSSFRNFWLSDEALRLRQVKSNKITEKVELTYKGPKRGNTMKVREEITIEVSNGDATQRILDHMGFQKAAIVKKERKNWHLMKNVVISYDEVEKLGSFLEIEIPSSENPLEITRTKEQIHQIVKEIIPNWDGLEERRSYLELLILKEKNE